MIPSIKENLWAIDEIGRTLMYVYAGSEKVLLLDTGFGLLDLPELVGALCPDREIVVVNTHAHGDHNGGNGQFLRVLVGQGDAQAGRLDMDEATRTQFFEHFLKHEPKLSGKDLSSWKPRAPKEIVELHDGDVIDLGSVHLEVLETPGHTSAASACLTGERFPVHRRYDADVAGMGASALLCNAGGIWSLIAQAGCAAPHAEGYLPRAWKSG